MTDMALLKYFKRIDSKKPEKVEAVLPKMDGPLATLMPVSSIETANKAVRAQMMENARAIEPHEGENSADKKLRGNYQFFNPKEKADLGRRAAELGITSTIREGSPTALKSCTPSTKSDKKSI